MDIKQRSQFVNIFADKAGIDGYSTATFDLYKDAAFQVLYQELCHTQGLVCGTKQGKESVSPGLIYTDIYIPCLDAVILADRLLCRGFGFARGLVDTPPQDYLLVLRVKLFEYLFDGIFVDFNFHTTLTLEKTLLFFLQLKVTDEQFPALMFIVFTDGIL